MALQLTGASQYQMFFYLLLIYESARFLARMGLCISLSLHCCSSSIVGK